MRTKGQGVPTTSIGAGRVIRAAFGSVAALSLAACAGRHNIGMAVAPELVSGNSVTSVALLGSLHVADSVRWLADSALTESVTKVCPSVRVLPADETERQLAARGVVAPRRLTASFAREARSALNVDLLIAPSVTGLIYDTRGTIAGLLDVIGRPAHTMFDDRAGVALEGWDLRSAELAVWVVRTHASENSWTSDPSKLLRNAAGDAAKKLAPLCRQPATARQER